MLSLAGTGPVVLAVFVILIFFSVVSWAIIFYKLFQIHKANSESVRFMDFFWKTKRFDTIAAQADRFSSSPLVMLFNEGYSELKQVMDGDAKQEQTGVSTDLGDIDNVTRALRRATNQEINRLEKYTTFLATTGSASPFIGLFGTVWGIMVAFEGIGRTGSASLAVVAPGISEALRATAIGLIAAIPAVMAYNHFQHKIRVLVKEMDSFSTEFLNIVQRNITGK
ncbi:protein TolQ [Trichlorobacter sp.]|uniref:protein TolQ n=1 Tax=Trichlorobacter sp. TaxID=2911007 RepID=UPI002A35CFB5|nr:protein TolQ [Trichlorobacter sp.]MDY0383806.1 protein TolQ [Trichlorobacter sp.]